MPTPHSIRPGQLPDLAKLLDGVFRDGQGVHDQRVFRDFPLVFAEDNLHRVRVLERDGRIVSHVALWACEMLVGGTRLKLGVTVLVATHPEYRGRGYAKLLMEDFAEILRAGRFDAGILWTGIPEFYRQLGWQEVVPRGWLVSDVRHAIAQTAVLNEAGTDPHVVPYEAAQHLSGVVALHEREPIRIERTPREYEILLKLPKMHVWVAERNGRVAAYVVVGQAINKWGVIEYGGSAADIVATIRHAIGRPEIRDQTPLVIFHPRDDLAEIFAEIDPPPQPIECSKGRGCEMLLVVDPARATPEILEQVFVWGLDFT